MSISERVTKKNDMKVNDSISSFDNFVAQQHHDVYEVFYNFISEVKPIRILEIGTGLGGFTRFLHIICNELNLETNIRSYDISDKCNWYKDTPVDLRIENIFSEDFKSVDSEVIDFIQGEGTTIVLCDGGNKKEEFNLLSNYIKVNDFIFAHDYSKDKQTFLQEINIKIWNWTEISLEDVQESMDKNGLVQYKEDIFSKVVWLSTTKVK